MAITQIPSEFISTNAISGTIIADNAITAVHIATNAVSGTLIADNAVTAVHIATNAVSGTLIADNAITAVHISGNSITAALLQDNAVGTDQLAGIARGKIIYGDSSGDPQLLTLGSNGTVLKSDGTDLSWASESNAITALNNATENELVTVGATTTELEAESGLTWDTNTLTLTSASANGGLSLRGYNGPVLTLGSSSSYDPRIDFEDQNATSHAASIFYDQDADTLRILRTVSGSAVDGIAINASGQVGIGTASPSAPLDVVVDSSVWAGEFTQSNTSNGDGVNVTVGSTAAADYALSIRSNAGNNHVLAAKANGNVGIGTASPYSGTNVTSLTVNATSYPAMALQIGGSNAGLVMANSAGLDVYSIGNKVMNLITNDTTRLSITGGGAVTIPGTLGVGAGSASAPSLSFEGDTNTGLYSVAGDNIGFTTGGTARGFWSATQFNVTGNGVFSGNGTFGGTLGVTGAVTASARLNFAEHIIGSSATGYIQMTSGSGKAWALSQAGGGAPGTDRNTFGVHHWDASAWSNPLLIDSAGQVCINTNSIPAAAKLTVHGPVRLTNSYLYLRTGTSTGVWVEDANSLRFGTSDTERMVISSAGHVEFTSADSAAQIKITPTGTNAPGIINFNTPGTGRAGIQVQGTERLTILEADGKVGIGTNAPAADLHIRSAANTSTHLRLERYESDEALVNTDIVASIDWYSNDGSVASNATTKVANIDAEILSTALQTALTFNTYGTSLVERMRITNLGQVLIGMSAGYATDYYLGLYAGSSTAGIGTQNLTTGATNYVALFRSNGVSTIGSINCTNTATQFNTSSDYRLKENVDYTWDATTRLKQLKPARFNWIADDTNTLEDGFLAHEVSSIVPEAICGEKDGSEMQGMDHSKLVPLLVKTIQELEARLTAGGL